MEQEVRFCTTSDGVRIAYATMGRGSPPLVCVPIWLSMMKYAEHDPRMESFFQELAATRQVVLYDRRGTGMSDRDVSDFSRGALVKDLEAVIDHLKLRRMALFTWDMGGPVAIEYAHRYPEKVSHLVLFGCFARGGDVGIAGRPTPEASDALVGLFRDDWEVGSETSQLLVMPGADPDTARRYFTALRASSSGHSASAQLMATDAEDVTGLLPKITTPTLVLHPRHDRVVPFELGRQLASLMPNAHLVPLDWNVHWDMTNADAVRRTMEEFLGEGEEAGETPEAGGFRTILFTDMEGSTTLTQELGDAKAQNILRTHNTIVRDALAAHSGSETKHTGDGIMASFTSASAALEAAVAIQKALAGHNEANPDAAIRVRIGLNAGEPVAEDEDLFGTAVQLAARVCDRAEPGQILVADVVQQLAAGKGFIFVEVGEATLKGFEKPVRMHEVRWRDEWGADSAR